MRPSQVNSEDNVVAAPRDHRVLLVYAICALLGHAYGMTLAVLSLYLRGRGQTADAIGSLSSYFAMGVIACSLPVGTMISRMGARPVLAGGLLGYSLVTAALPWLNGFWPIALARALDGVFSVCVWTASESTLLAYSPPDRKASATTRYAVALSLGYVSGPMIARILTEQFSMRAVFYGAASLTVVAALVAILALPPLRHTEGHDEASREAPTLSLLGLIQRVRVSIVAAFAYGYFQSALLLFVPLYFADVRHFTTEQVVMLPAFFAGGMLLLMNFIGPIGDRFGHLRVLRVLIAVGIAVIIGFTWLTAYPLIAFATFIAGAALSTVWPLSLALQGVVLPAREYGRANGVVNGFYAMGLVLGPFLSGRVFKRLGGDALFWQFAVMWFAVMVFALVFDGDDPRSKRHVPATTL
ncbi:MAG: MFS transporter [Deltaproteobacteria bacterium]|nr:MFS transporter [Deltaproteobacteria bacterium]